MRPGPALALALLVAAPLAAQASHAQLRAGLVDDLTAYVERQRRDKALPAVCLAILDVEPDSAAEWTWASGFGAAAMDGTRKADATTVHRVGSISKLFTATAATVLAAQGRLDLDAPVQRWLPDFKPDNPFGGEVTVRRLLGHRGGLVRESPVGHYFDATEPGLRPTVASLNHTALAAAPGSTLKYSNPGPAVVGRVIEVVTGRRFEDAVQELVLAPLGLADSSFDARPDLVARTAHGVMWTRDGRAIPTPAFALGCGPAMNLRSTVADLLKFARSWLPRSRQRLLTPDQLQAMWAPQNDDGSVGGAYGCGLGFFVAPLDDRRRVGHRGAVYGFAVELAALPDDGLAVAVAVTADFANALAEAIADRALRGLLAVRNGERLAPPVWPQPVGAAAARALAGRYVLGDEWFDLRERGGELLFDPCIGVATVQRRLSDVLVSDDRMSPGGRVLRVQANGGVHDGMVAFARAADACPPPPPGELLPLLGEYGWDHGVLVVYEDQGRLGVLIDWLTRDLPEREGQGRWRFPPGIYATRWCSNAMRWGTASPPCSAACASRAGPTRRTTRRTTQRMIRRTTAAERSACARSRSCARKHGARRRRRRNSSRMGCGRRSWSTCARSSRR